MPTSSTSASGPAAAHGCKDSGLIPTPGNIARVVAATLCLINRAAHGLASVHTKPSLRAAATDFLPRDGRPELLRSRQPVRLGTGRPVSRRRLPPVGARLLDRREHRRRRSVRRPRPVRSSRCGWPRPSIAPTSSAPPTATPGSASSPRCRHPSAKAPAPPTPRTLARPPSNRISLLACPGRSPPTTRRPGRAPRSRRLVHGDRRPSASARSTPITA